MKSRGSTWHPVAWKTCWPKAPRWIVPRQARSSTSSFLQIISTTTRNSTILMATLCMRYPRFRGLNTVIMRGPGRIILLTAPIHQGGEVGVKYSTNITHCQNFHYYDYLSVINLLMHYMISSSFCSSQISIRNKLRTSWGWSCAKLKFS